MARKKTITREQILAAAYEVVATEGFSRFTARNIASKMKCSTQPIYLEFKNMDDLKTELFEQIYSYLSNEVFPVEHTGHKIIDLAYNYIHFANSEKRLYRSLYLDEYGGGEAMQEFSYNYFTDAVKQDAAYANLSKEQIESLHNGTWIVATGIAALMSSGIIHPTDVQIEKLIQDSIDAILVQEEPIKVDY
ncbi:TetR/AcrR family transcriptional regulator [Candidatus Enterococcus courvalinii]|uniref:TetR/AcrR family transcriptional regulator n=1 Tax=Candidatus Enterococcus courvalinii TaxID=2815329 RepID=A0ABS3I2X6_9ENTE|nr:TetR/AcrR family transcriptional regulator [Enterococcus sp. MSG2901]MBO0483052.1 TetR/AcrR family transcriptional regulator [Enterococcus sp. MSG2901]